MPVESLSLESDYSGGYGKKYDSSLDCMSSTWNHLFKIELMHNPLPLLSYSVGVNINGYIPQHLAHQTKQECSANVVVTPGSAWKNVSLTAGEIFSISHTGSQQDLFSRAVVGASMPLAKSLNASYKFGWDWTDLSEAPVLNDFSHSLNLVYNGIKRPFTVSGGYTFRHGSSGVRHDINSSGYYPFTDNFGVREWANLSFYRENGSRKRPFILGISGVYSF